MQTHEDRDFRVLQFMSRLQERAEKSMKHKMAKITAGEDGEPVIDSFDRNGFCCVQRPDDEQGILRISVGGGSGVIMDDQYCVFRGDRTRCAYMLEQAAKSLRSRIIVGEKRYEISESDKPTPTPNLAQFEGYTVGQWCPTPDGSGAPTAVVLSVEFSGQHTLDGWPCSAIGLRLKSRHAINTLIEVLEKYRDEVFPEV